MGTALFTVAVAPLLISSVVAAIVTCCYFACVKKEADQIRRGWMLSKIASENKKSPKRPAAGTPSTANQLNDDCGCAQPEPTSSYDDRVSGDRRAR